jgi:hypothetical protein
MDILLDSKNKSAQEFLIYGKIQDGRQGSKVQNRPNLTPQILFRLGIWLPFIRFGQNYAWTYYLTLQTSLRKNFLFIAKSKMAAGGQRSKIDHIWPHKSHFGSAFGSRSSYLDKIWHEHTSWTQKEVCARIYQLAQNPRWPPEVKGPKSTKFDPTNHILARHLDIVHQIWTKSGMKILLDHTIKFGWEFFS